MNPKLREYIKTIVRELLGEMSTTGAVSGYSTPFAFSARGGKNVATKTAERMGFTVSDCKCEGECSCDKKSLTEDINYNVAKDITAFQQQLASSESTLLQKYVDSLKKKFLGKTVEMQASKGYGQFNTKYTVKVVDVSIEDWYKKESYQLIFTGDDKKKYFVNQSVPVRIITSPTSTIPAAEVPSQKPSPSVQPTVTAPTNPVQPKPPQTDLDRQISK